MRALLLALAVLLAGLMPALAVQPDEVLGDPGLEARARTLSARMRCLVCQNQSIDDSDAPLARDLRILIRERLVAGDSDDQVESFLVARYGDFVLLRPRFGGRTLVLWLGPFLILLAGIAIVVRHRRRAAPALEEALSDDERRRVDEALEGRPPGDITKV